jgi:hypothetical protein
LEGVVSERLDNAGKMIPEERDPRSLPVQDRVGGRNTDQLFPRLAPKRLPEAGAKLVKAGVSGKNGNPGVRIHCIVTPLMFLK